MSSLTRQRRRLPSGSFGPILTIFIAVAAPGCGEDRGTHLEPMPAISSVTSRPNIILITLESVRADHVGCYGYDRDTTPALDSLGKQGIVFEQAYSVTSWTLASHASIFTGLYPTAHKAVKPLDRLDESYTTIAEYLQQNGYHTAGIISGPFLRRTHKLNQGFTYYDESASSSFNNQAHGDITNPRMEELVTQFLDQKLSSSDPFFLFVYLWDPHYDYIPPPPYDTMFQPDHAEPIDISRFVQWTLGEKKVTSQQMAYLLAQYDGEIRCTDDLLGRLWNKLKGLDLWDNSVIIVTADHGEEFFEHQRWGHKNNLYNETLHVPLIIKPAAGIGPKRDKRLVNLIDLYPTILAVADVTPAQPQHGRSLWDPPPENPVTSFYELVTTYYFTAPTGKRRSSGHQWSAVREGDFKLVTQHRGDECQLFNLALDPGEQTPMTSQYDSKTKALRAKIERFRTAMEKVAHEWSSAPPGSFNDSELKRLRSLGYIDGGDDQ